MMHFMKGMALPFSAAKEWLEVVGKAFRFLGYHRFYPPVLKKSLKISQLKLMQINVLPCFPFDHDVFHQLPINENQVQKGTYFINFLGASSSKGLIFPSRQPL